LLIVHTYTHTHTHTHTHKHTHTHTNTITQKEDHVLRSKVVRNSLDPAFAQTFRLAIPTHRLLLHDQPMTCTVEVCCSVLRVAVCCVLPYVTKCCSVSQLPAISPRQRTLLGCVVVCCSVFAECCSVLQCVAVPCSVLQCVAVPCSVL